MSTVPVQASKWPKHVSPLTSEERAISDDFMNYWLSILPGKYGLVDRFNHGYSVSHAPATFLTTLEIGTGRGEHIQYENLSDEQLENYYALDIRDNMAGVIKSRFPKVKTVLGDIQAGIDFADGFFDRALAVHVLEHLPDLPRAIKETHRLLKADGQFSVVIPCEGGLTYAFAREISSKRIFEQRYKRPYKWFIEREHLNRPHEILEELEPYFSIADQTYFPMRIPMLHVNLCIGLTLKPKR